MLITVLEGGTGSGADAASYLIGPVDSAGRLRDRVIVHRGDPVQVAAIIDCIDQLVHRYTSLAVNFGNDRPMASQITGVLDDLESLVYAGVKPRYRCLLAVEHGKRVGTSLAIDLHMLLPRIDLKTGSSYNALPPGWERPIGYLVDAWNFQNGWMRGLDPLRLDPTKRRKKRGIGAEEGIFGNLIDPDRARKARQAFEKEVAARAESYWRIAAIERRRYTRLKAPAPASLETERAATLTLLGAAGAMNGVSLRGFLTLPVPEPLAAPASFNDLKVSHDRHRTATSAGAGGTAPSTQTASRAAQTERRASDNDGDRTGELDAAKRRSHDAVEQLRKAAGRRWRKFDAIETIAGQIAHAIEQTATRVSQFLVSRVHHYLARLPKPGNPRPGSK